jgi:hypothetical protein
MGNTLNAYNKHTLIKRTIVVRNTDYEYILNKWSVEIVDLSIDTVEDVGGTLISYCAHKVEHYRQQIQVSPIS